MLRAYLFILACLLPGASVAQVLEGLVLDKESKAIVVGASVFNRRTFAVAFSDTNGYYSLEAAAGDTIIFKRTGYQPAMEVMTYTISKKYKSVSMLPLVYSLKEATVVGRTKFQQDSAALHEQFGHELNKTLVAPPKGAGLGCSGCIGWLADKITGNSKKPKQFRKTFAADEEQRFIDTRYTLPLVSKLTGLSDTLSVLDFMYQYPMEYEFARAASDLELKGWIRNCYKAYVKAKAVDSK